MIKASFCNLWIHLLCHHASRLWVWTPRSAANECWRFLAGMISVSFSVIYVIQLKPNSSTSGYFKYSRPCMGLRKSLLKPSKSSVSLSATLFESQSLYSLPFPISKNMKGILRWCFSFWTSFWWWLQIWLIRDLTGMHRYMVASCVVSK